MRYLSSLFVILLIFACSSNQKRTVGNSIESNQVKYAKGFSIVEKSNGFFVEVYNPWDNYSVLESYFFSKDTNIETSDSCITFKKPFKSCVYLSSTYLGMVSLLDARETVRACSNANWIYDSALFNRYLNGEIADLGNDLTISAEAVISKNPDCVMKYIYKGQDPKDAIIRNVGIPILYNIEFMEDHPLGRAEWIKLLGIALGKKAIADSLFSEIEKSYLNYVEVAKGVDLKPDVLVGGSYKGTWYAVGGKSFVAQLLRDAGAEYYWSSDSGSGSIPLSLENVMLRQRDASIWINANASSINEILNIEPRCELFSAIKNKEVYHYNKRLNRNGGLDYFESGVIRPDLLLRDLLIILHPGLIGENEQTIYWQKLD